MRGHQKGFAAIGLVVILLVIAVGAVGWYVYTTRTNKNQNASEDQNQTAATKKEAATQQETAPAAQNIVKIPELGIQITVSDALKNLTYTVRNGEYDQGTFIGADLSTTELEALDANCVSSYAPLGGLFRSEGQAPATQDSPTAQPPATKQFPAFSIAYDRGNGGACSDKAAVTAELDKIGKVKDGILSIDLIE